MCSVPVSKLPSLAVAVCGCLPWFVHVIVSPTWTVIVAGEKLKSTIVDDGSPAACARVFAWRFCRLVADEDGCWDCADVGGADAAVVVDADEDWTVDVVAAVVVVVVVDEDVVVLDCGAVLVVDDVVVDVVPGLALAAIVCSMSGTTRTATPMARRARRRVRGIS